METGLGTATAYDRVIDGILRSAYAFGDYEGDLIPGIDDPTPVPEWIIPAVKAYIRSCGYRIREHPGAMSSDGDTGRTYAGTRLVSYWSGGSPASVAHGLTHEACHVTHIKAGLTDRQVAIDDAESQMWGEPMLEEITAALATGIIDTVLADSDGRATAGYLGGRLAAAEEAEWLVSIARATSATIATQVLSAIMP